MATRVLLLLAALALAGCRGDDAGSSGASPTQPTPSTTCGHHHLLQQFALNDRAILYLVTSRHADRMKTQYGGPLQPDETIGDPREAVNRAVAWLHGGS